MFFRSPRAEARSPLYETHPLLKIRPRPRRRNEHGRLAQRALDYLLQSGFQSDMWYEMPEGEQTLDNLRRAIEQA